MTRIDNLVELHVFAVVSSCRRENDVILTCVPHGPIFIPAKGNLVDETQRCSAFRWHKEKSHRDKERGRYLYIYLIRKESDGRTNGTECASREPLFFLPQNKRRRRLQKLFMGTETIVKMDN